MQKKVSEEDVTTNYAVKNIQNDTHDFECVCLVVDCVEQDLNHMVSPFTD